MNVFLILAIGGVVGFLSGLFGVGGGFIMTPILIFLGIPPAVAVGTQANQLIAAGVSSTMVHARRKTIDFKMGLILLLGSVVGSILGVQIFKILKELGQIDLTISLFYVFFLSFIGLLMLWESLKKIFINEQLKTKSGTKFHKYFKHLPFQTHFPTSHIEVSIIVPVTIGFIGGLLVAIMGIGGGFILVPAMIYLLAMPVSTVIGTSIFQIAFSTSVVTYLQAVTNQTVDIVLAFFLLLGGAIGAQFGTSFSMVLKSEYTRALMGLLILTVACGLGFNLILEPSDLYSLEVELP